jgi:hypothetical protein
MWTWTPKTLNPFKLVAYGRSSGAQRFSVQKYEMEEEGKIQGLAQNSQVDPES